MSHNFTARADMITIVPGEARERQSSSLTFPQNTYGDWYTSDNSTISYVGMYNHYIIMSYTNTILYIKCLTQIFM